MSIAAGAGFLYTDKKKERERTRTVRQAEEAADMARAKAGPYFESDKKLSPMLPRKLSTARD